MKRFLYYCLGVIMAVCFVEFKAFASNQIEAVGVGTRAVGRGGVETAIADDCAAMVVNPAGITQIKRQRLDMGMSFEVPYFRFENDYTKTKDEHRHTYSVPAFGFAQTRDRLTLGLGAYGIGGVGADLCFETPFFSEKKRGRTKLGLAKITPTVAYKVRPNFSVGFSLNIHYGILDMRTPLGPYNLNLDNLEGYGWGAALGVLYKLNEKLSFGACYTTQSFNEDFEAESAYMEISSLLVPGGFKGKYHAKMIDFEVPQRMGIGIAFSPSKQIVIGFDADWINYSKHFDKMTFEFYDGDGPDRMLALEMNFRDVYVFALGLEYRFLNGVVFRCGYDYCSDIAPEGSELHVLGLYSDIHHFAAGIGYEWDHLALDFAFSRSLTYKEHTTQTKLPTSAQPAPELNNSYHETRDYYYSVMISWKY